MSDRFTDQEIAEARLVLPDARTCPYEVYAVDVPPTLEEIGPITRGVAVQMPECRTIYFKLARFGKGHKWEVCEYA
jgi:hypothetical protein